ncbi:protein-export chaperone SecB [Mammaliicoccus sciuri]|uniref:protein-export chaperone SecB n=1 Tax=Mammaliicoccus sciuri TaxID=1296 RepID=UPI003BA217D3
MNIIMEFKSFRVISVDYKVENQNEDTNLDINEDEENDIANLRLNAGFSDIDDNGNAQLQLELNVKDSGDDFLRTIKLSVIGLFKFNEFENKDYTEKILKENGTAILMPYIRSYLSTLTGFDNSTDHLLLPTINVSAMFENE